MQNFLKNKKFLILGGSGFVGKSITEILLSCGARVVVLTRNSNKIKPLKVSGYPGQLEIISGNIFEDGLLDLLIKDKFAVINLCGILHICLCLSGDAQSQSFAKFMGLQLGEVQISPYVAI